MCTVPFNTDWGLILGKSKAVLSVHETEMTVDHVAEANLFSSNGARKCWAP
jgi:hypothetical protein